MKIYLKLIVVTFLTLSTFSLFAKSDSTFINANKAYTQKLYLSYTVIQRSSRRRL